MLERLANCNDSKVKEFALENIAGSAEARAFRQSFALAPFMAAIPSPAATKHRLIYDGQGKFRLPGKLVRKEGDPDAADHAVNEAFKFSGVTYDFYDQLFNRNSLDNRGMSLISTIHYRRNFDNAFWNGEQMVYGDGDGVVFRRFTRALEVVGHELTHGVVSFTSNLEYQDEPGALNEHFADVMGILIRQWKNRETVDKASWLIGADLLIPAPTRRALRDISAPGTAYQDDPFLGSDPQPKHIKDKYTGNDDNGGVHINSSIPSFAFYKAATAIGGFAWEKTGRIWYDTLLKLTVGSNFQDAAHATYQVARAEFGAAEAKAVKAAWAAVGIKAS